MIFQEPPPALNPVMSGGRRSPRRSPPTAARRGGASRPVGCSPRWASPTPGAPAAGVSFQFSGGMKQRVMIAIALCRPPAPADRRRADHGPSTSPSRPRCSTCSPNCSAARAWPMLLITHDLGVVARRPPRGVMYLPVRWWRAVRARPSSPRRCIRIRASSSPVLPEVAKRGCAAPAGRRAAARPPLPGRRLRRALSGAFLRPLRRGSPRLAWVGTQPCCHLYEGVAIPAPVRAQTAGAADVVAARPAQSVLGGGRAGVHFGTQVSCAAPSVT